MKKYLKNVFFYTEWGPSGYSSTEKTKNKENKEKTNILQNLDERTKKLFWIWLHYKNYKANITKNWIEIKSDWETKWYIFDNQKIKNLNKIIKDWKLDDVLSH